MVTVNEIHVLIRVLNVLEIQQENMYVFIYVKCSINSVLMVLDKIKEIRA